MQKLIALSCLFAVVAVVCSVDVTRKPVQVLKSEINTAEDGSYKYVYETDDGSYKEETGTVINAGTEDAKVIVSGSYKYIDEATGEEVSVQYTADQNGFYPSGSHIAKEISEVALKSKDNPREDNLHPSLPKRKF